VNVQCVGAHLLFVIGEELGTAAHHQAEQGDGFRLPCYTNCGAVGDKIGLVRDDASVIHVCVKLEIARGGRGRCTQAQHTRRQCDRGPFRALDKYVRAF
jgi:hypothetical protein